MTSAIEVVECASAAEILARAPRLDSLLEASGAAAKINQSWQWLMRELELRGSTADVAWQMAFANGELIGYLPAMRRPKAIRAEVRTVGLSLYNGPVFHVLGDRCVAGRQALRAVESAIASRLVAQARYCPVLLEEAATDSGLYLSLAQNQRVFAAPVNPLPQCCWETRIPTQLQEYKAGWKPKTRKNIERNTRKLSEELHGELRVAEYCRTSEVQAYLDALATLYPKTWHFREDPERWTGMAAQRALASLAGNGLFKGYILWGGGRPLAYAHTYRNRRRVELDTIGYDPALSRYGTGTILVAMVLQQIIEEQSAEVFSFGYGDNTYKRVLGRHSYRATSTYFVSGPELVARLMPLRATSWLVQRFGRRSEEVSSE